MNKFLSTYVISSDVDKVQWNRSADKSVGNLWDLPYASTGMRCDIVEVKNAWAKYVYRVTVSAICSSADLLCRVKATILILSRKFPKIFSRTQMPGY